ncbi:MAG: hypothetical protein DCF23_11455 [Cyanobium sp.]|nr:MAG: hypothetical protein DCF23_11455 [Cyanobium sp.]
MERVFPEVGQLASASRPDFSDFQANGNGALALARPLDLPPWPGCWRSAASRRCGSTTWVPDRTESLPWSPVLRSSRAVGRKVDCP